MTTANPLPSDPRLAEIAAQLEAARGASMLADANSTIVWVSEELRHLVGDPTDEELGIGMHAVEAYMLPTWSSRLTIDSQLRSFAAELPLVLAETAGGKEGLRAIVLRGMERWGEAGGFVPSRELVDRLFENLEPADTPAIGVDADGVIYRTVESLGSATDKAVRDAGGVPVTVL